MDDAAITKAQEQLDTLKKQRVEIDALLVKNQENVILWLESVIRTCQREVYQLKDHGDIADGEIQVPWNILQEQIATLRETQELRRTNVDYVVDAENDIEYLKLGEF